MANTMLRSLSRRRSTAEESAPERRALPEAVRRAVPVGFDAVGEALASKRNASAACAVVGRDVARDGASLGEALDGLRATYRAVTGAEPGFEATSALAVGWSESTLEYLHQLTCEDPLTGLASLAHVRTRLVELYRDCERDGTRLSETHGLVVLDLLLPQPWSSEHPFTRALHLVGVTECIRMVFSGGETIGRAGQGRALVVVRRSSELGLSVALLRELIHDLDLGSVECRVWIEGLPPATGAAAQLLDELARC